MKHKLLSKFKNYLSKDLFSTTQNQLTLTYSGLMMLFLTLFIVIVYSLLYFVILNDQKRELNSLLNQKSHFIVNNFRKDLIKQRIVLTRDDQFFYYILDEQGVLLAGSEVIPEKRSELLSKLQGWMPKPREVRQYKTEVVRPPWEMRNPFEQIEPKERNKDDINKKLEKTHTVHLLITGRPIYYKNLHLATIYIGKDISPFYLLLERLLFILITISILFLGVAFLLSHRMSKRAMIPIKGAFTKQREFVADASHELRTPLSVLLSSIDAMEMTGTLETEPYAKKIVGNMRDEVNWMRKLVEDLLTLARSDSGIIEILDEKFDFRPFVDKAIQSLEPLAQEKLISLQLDAPDMLLVNGDSERLKQLLYILLDNAIKYTPAEGHVSLKLSIEEAGKEKNLHIIVKDSGMGIPPDDLDHIFERFYRADKARTRKMGGHGLGLAIAKWIVETHKGKISISSSVGNGSTFTIYIPITTN